MRLVWMILVLAVAAQGAAKPVPPSPYMLMMYKYADTLLKHGRDANGLLVGELDRTTYAPIKGATADARRDQNLLRLLYLLSEVSTRPAYREAANAELKWFLEKGTLGEGDQDRAWMLWERCFELNAEASKSMAINLVEDAKGSMRDAGFAIRAFAIGYERTKDQRMLDSIDGLLERLLGVASAAEVASVAIDCDGAARRVPTALAARLREVAAKSDKMFCRLKQEDWKAGLWQTSAETRMTVARVGMMCVSRYENTGNVGYRDLMIAAADAYAKGPPVDEDLWPMTFGHAISLQLAAWRETSDERYLNRARELADLAVKLFWEGSALPRGTSKSEHYKAGTGADTLALALVELHLEILGITAVRCPPNTIDR